jgi:hypothetical protein
MVDNEKWGANVWPFVRIVLEKHRSVSLITLKDELSECACTITDYSYFNIIDRL